MKLETDRGHFFVDGVRRTDITQEEFDSLVRAEDMARYGPRGYMKYVLGFKTELNNARSNR